jgi:hypothetical protein
MERIATTLFALLALTGIAKADSELETTGYFDEIPSKGCAQWVRLDGLVGEALSLCDYDRQLRTGYYTLGRIIRLSNDNGGLERVQGVFRKEGGKLTLLPLLTTCPKHASNLTELSYDLDLKARRLNLGNKAGIVSYWLLTGASKLSNPELRETIRHAAGAFVTTSSTIFGCVRSDSRFSSHEEVKTAFAKTFRADLDLVLSSGGPTP